ncbi:MAG: hypothetical protein H6725_05420 [Sandaracinaceae bacterium]|nr:hypothetical protein [Sandaracinaceae bacterium]
MRQRMARGEPGQERAAWSATAATRVLAPTLLLGALTLLACQTPPPPGPAETLRQFLRLMDESAIRSGPSGEVLTDEDALKGAYGLLSAQTQASLRERSDLAASLAGGDYQPWDVLIPGRFRLRFQPVAFDETITDGHPRRATVRVRGRAAAEVAEVPLVEEDGHWRITLDIPHAAEASF